MADVELENVSKTFSNGVVAVDQLNLKVSDEEFLVVVGPSGCGKTTTLRMIAGLNRPSSGDIRIAGRSVLNAAPKDRNIAMVFQDHGLYPHMTVYNNMAFGLKLRCGGLRRWWRQLAGSRDEANRLAAQRSEIPNQVRSAAQALNIESLLDRMPDQLSGGERQRAALGRALVRRPAVFLFDEPLSNLDAKLRVVMRRQLKQLHQRLRATMIYVTHDQVEALTLGDRIVVMERGKVQQVGPPMDVYGRPRNRFVAGFVGPLPMNFVAGSLRRTNFSLEFEGGGLKVDVSAQGATRLKEYIGRKVELGVRPEHIRLTNDPDQPGVARARVAVTEPLGDSLLCHLDLSHFATGEPTEPCEFNLTDALIACKTDARSPLRVGDVAAVQVDGSAVHLFDPQSGFNLTN